jgi:hypothetical protein
VNIMEATTPPPRPARRPASGRRRAAPVFGEYRAPTGVGGALRCRDRGEEQLRADVDRVPRRLAADEDPRRQAGLAAPNGEQLAVRARDAGMEVVYDGSACRPSRSPRARSRGRRRDRAVDLRARTELIPAVIDGCRSAASTCRLSAGSSPTVTPAS